MNKLCVIMELNADKNVHLKRIVTLTFDISTSNKYNKFTNAAGHHPRGVGRVDGIPQGMKMLKVGCKTVQREKLAHHLVLMKS